MSESKSIITLERKAAELDNVARKFSVYITADNGPFGSALTLSQGITSLRELLDDGIMREIMKLANSPLGFLTDRPNDKNPNPYQISEVRDAIIEASLRGFHVCGNEFNIIAGRFYGAKAGLHRKVTAYPGVTDFKETFGVPKNSGDRGAIVIATATWRKDGISQELSREFAIKVNAYMGVDAIIGKCQRKLYSAVLNQLSGTVTPEGEVDDATPARSIEVKSIEIPEPSKAEPAKSVVGSVGSGQPYLDPAAEVRDRLSKTVFVEQDILEVMRNNVLAEKEQSIDQVSAANLQILLDNWPAAVEQMKGKV